MKNNPPTCNLQQWAPLAYPAGVQVFNLYLADNWDDRPEHQNFKIQDIDNAVRDLIQSNYFDRAHQYGVPANLTFAGSTNTNRPFMPCPHNLIRNSIFDIMANLSCEEATAPLAGVPLATGIPTATCILCAMFPGGCFSDVTNFCLATPNTTGNTIYNIFIPRNTPLDDFGRKSCSDYNGFHFQIPSLPFFGALGSQGIPLYFTVIPTACFDGISAMMYAVSHELVEAATNPLPMSHWIEQSFAPPVPQAFIDPGRIMALATDSEPADICENRGGIPFFPADRSHPWFQVASYWSNSDHDCYPTVPHSTQADRSLYISNIDYHASASQSSTAYGADASRAVDGNTDGTFWNGSVTHTNAENQPWWQVDLSEIAYVDSVRIWNRTDCCMDRLTNFYVLASDLPFNSTDLPSTLAQPGVSSFYVSGPASTIYVVPMNRSARYVRIQLAGSNVPLSLAEVMVLGFINEARTPFNGQVASQSSTGFWADAWRAIDGNIDGAFWDGSVSHTWFENNPYWDLDLGPGGLEFIDSIDIRNRTDCCGERLSDVRVFLSDRPFLSTNPTDTFSQPYVFSSDINGPAGDQRRILVGRGGRYVRIQLKNPNYLQLAEVLVYGVRPVVH